MEHRPENGERGVSGCYHITGTDSNGIAINCSCKKYMTPRESGSPEPNKEAEKIKQAIREFSERMGKKMLKKMAGGYHGWDDRKTISDDVILNMLQEHTDDLIVEGNPEEIDIANLCMIIWWRRQNP